VESYRLDRYIRLAPQFIRCPVLLLLAGRDRIVDNARTKQFFAHWASQDKTLVEYPEAHHTLEFEPQPDFFIEDILRWLERVVAALPRTEPPSPPPLPAL